MSGSSIGNRASLTLVPRVPLFESEDFDFISFSLLTVALFEGYICTALTLAPRVPLFESEDFEFTSVSSLDADFFVVEN